jgi:hypothetical protein
MGPSNLPAIPDALPHLDLETCVPKGVFLFLLSLAAILLPVYACAKSPAAASPLQQALRELEQARRHLLPGAAADRRQARALSLTDQALREVRAAQAHRKEHRSKEHRSKEHLGRWQQVYAQINCEAMRPNDCRGMYGFTVKPDGHFTVGNDEIGPTLTGSITATERTRLNQLAGEIAAGGTRQAPTCVRIHTVPGLHDVVELTLPGAAPLVVYDRGSLPGKFCFLRHQQTADAVHALMQQLMAKYYPVPFPK